MFSSIIRIFESKRSAMRKKVIKRIVLFLAIGVFSLLFARYYLYNDYSNEKAVEYLVRHAERRSKNRCAQYVRQAVEHGGCPTFGQPPSACDYDLFLPDLGFRQIDNAEYVPMKGDIVVFSAIKGHKHGHICMYDGHQWISDFKQRSMYSANAYRNRGTHSYWRRPDGKVWRKVSLNSWKRTIRLYLGL